MIGYKHSNTRPTGIIVWWQTLSALLPEKHLPNQRQLWVSTQMKYCES
jgi:hypothetical protein